MRISSIIIYIATQAMPIFYLTWKRLYNSLPHAELQTTGELVQCSSKFDHKYKCTPLFVL